MTLKDWTKVRENKEEKVWFNTKTKILLEIFDVNIFTRNKTKGYGIWINRDLKKAFETKQAALKYAKNYMRKH